MALDYKSGLGRYRRYLQLMQTKPLWSASLWVILSLVLMIVLTWMALRPTLITISGLFGQIKQNEELSSRLDKKILTVRTAIQEMEAVDKDLPILDAAVPTAPKWETLADEVYRIATNSGLAINKIEIDRVQTVPAVQTKEKGKQTVSLIPTGLMPIKFTILAGGDYLQMKNAMSELEKLPRLLLFSDVIISEDKESGLELKITGEAAFMPERKAP